MSPRPVDPSVVATALLTTICVAGLTIGGLYVGSALDSHGGSSSQPQFISDSDVAAMNWVKSSTDPMDQFVVMGDAAEWLPYRTHRRILIGPWGIEWLGNDAYQRNLREFNQLSACQHEACVTSVILHSNVDPDYLYVPTERYTVRGMEMEPSPFLREELIQSEHYRLVHENEGVMIFSVHFQSPAERMLAEHGANADRVESTESDLPLVGSQSRAGQGLSRTV